MTHITSDSAADAGHPGSVPARRTRTVPPLYHVVAGAFVAWCLWAATYQPDAYRDAMQEDRFLEWLTVFAYGSAGVIALRRAIRSRRPFDGLVAMFLLFVAGEEMSWGQRVLGLTPPSYFLEHNTQQEMNLHNFSAFGGGPKEPLTLILVGYAVVLPLVARVGRGRRLLERLGATPPAAAIIPWFLVAVVLLVWYPFNFTGEWTELLAGSAFLVAVGASAATLGVLLPLGAAFGWGMALWSARGSGSASAVSCAAAEAQAIAQALNAETLGLSNKHKRAWTLVEEGRIDSDILRQRLATVPCDDRHRDARRRFAVDPWGTAYWIRVRRMRDQAAVTVYSFGPNRRRDTDAEDSRGGDDILARTTLRAP